MKLKLIPSFSSSIESPGTSEKGMISMNNKLPLLLLADNPLRCIKDILKSIVYYQSKYLMMALFDEHKNLPLI